MGLKIWRSLGLGRQISKSLILGGFLIFIKHFSIFRGWVLFLGLLYQFFVIFLNVPPPSHTGGGPASAGVRVPTAEGHQALVILRPKWMLTASAPWPVVGEARASAYPRREQPENPSLSQSSLSTSYSAGCREQGTSTTRFKLLVKWKWKWKLSQVKWVSHDFFGLNLWNFYMF